MKKLLVGRPEMPDKLKRIRLNITIAPEMYGLLKENLKLTGEPISRYIERLIKYDN